MGKKKFFKEMNSLLSLRHRLYGRYDIKSYTADLHTRLRELLIDEQLFLDSRLNEEKVMSLLGTNRFYLSRCIRIHEKTSFRKFLNSLRVSHAQKMFMDNINTPVTMMCFQSGFNSLSTFYRAFHTVVGISPTQWCLEYKIKLLRTLKH